MVLRRNEKRYMDVDGYTIEFYNLGPAIRISVVEFKQGGWFSSNKYIPIYNEIRYPRKIESYKLAAKEVLENYFKEKAKWL